MNNEKLSSIFTVIMFATLALYYLCSFKGKINYLFLFILVIQATGDIFFVRQGHINFKIGLSLYFIVNLILIIMLKQMMLNLNHNNKVLNIISYMAYTATILFGLALFLNIELAITILFGLIMILLVWIAYHYFTSFTKDGSFWMFFGIVAYLICSLASSFDIYIAANVYYVSLKILAYVVAMFCITKAMIIESKTVKS